MSAANFSESPTSPPVFNYSNNRISGADYDDNGNFINDGVSAKIFEYNAAGLIDETDVTVYDEGDYRVQKEFVGHDGDGRTIRIGTFDQLNEGTPEEDTTYQIRATMLGGALIILNRCESNPSNGRERPGSSLRDLRVLRNEDEESAFLNRRPGSNQHQEPRGIHAD